MPHVQISFVNLQQKAIFSLDKLLERTINRRADLGSFVEVNGGHGALAYTFRGEFEFLRLELAIITA